MTKYRIKYLLIYLFAFFQVHNVSANNWYQDRLKEFNIHTPEIKWGYPINYDLENENIRGVILLTNEQSYLERLNTITYVGAPTVKNAEIIANFLPDIEKPFPIYYVAVDTSVQLYELTEFLEELGKLSWEPEIRFISSNGSYLKLCYNNASYWTDRGFGSSAIICGKRFGSDLLINSMNEILFERTPLQIDDVFMKVKYLYQVNFKERDTDYSFPNWRHNDSKVFESEINRLMNSDNLDDMDSYLVECKHKLYLAEKFDTVSQMRPTNPIYFETGRKTSLKFLFKTWDEIHKAHYILRNEFSRKKWNLNYEEVIYNDDRDDLLNIMYPNLIVYSFNQYKEQPEIAPPPPVITEIEVVERE